MKKPPLNALCPQMLVQGLLLQSGVELTYCLCRISCEINFFFIIKVGIESCSVNRYNCRLRGEIRVLVAIETDSSHHLFSCKLRKENNPLLRAAGPWSWV